MPEAGRVITGSAGGLRLTAPGDGTRPLSDRVKQSLFSGLEAERPGVWERPMLDLFAGSGAAGIEALSRGAPAAVLVERDRRAVRAIEQNLDRTNLAGRARVVRADVAAFLSAGPEGVVEAPFGSVVVDPPYAETALLALALERLAERGWVDADGVVIAKHFWRDAPAEMVGALGRIGGRRFGESALSVYRRGPGAEAGGET